MRWSIAVMIEEDVLFFTSETMAVISFRDGLLSGKGSLPL
jgi:hypothetical protein